MAIVYPLALPSTPQFRRIELFGENAVGLTRSPFTYATQVQEFNGQIWQCSITLPPMIQADADAWQAFLLSLNGQVGTFTLGDPLHAEPRGSALGAPVVDGAGQSGQVLNTTGWDPSETGLLLKGDHIQLPNNRLHVVLNDVDSDGSGDAAIDIWPRLRESPADASTIITANPRCIFRLSSNRVNVQSADQTRTVSISFEGTEAI